MRKGVNNYLKIQLYVRVTTELECIEQFLHVLLLY